MAIGLVYIAIGVIALLSLLGLKDGGADEDSLLELLDTTVVGEIFLWVIILGLLAYVVWRIVEAIQDPLNYGNDWKGIARRIAIVLAASAYGLIAWSGIRAMIDDADGSEGFEEQRQMVSTVLAWNGGDWLLGICGVMVAVTALLELRYVAKGDHKPHLDIDHLPTWKKFSIHALAWVGHFARAIILAIIGYSLIRGAVHADPTETVNTDKAFNFIGESMLGHPLFVAVACGTIAYGVYMILLGIYLNLDKVTRIK
ncbi:hypothetical protein DQQ10_23570 [Pseudochryseolinea flava]|uniref:DUF1206 domain-containing protein n=2 Tax=Pseudochryseolinea flava TaxID=2059302 RepID=A0A364XX03_9BACT|nr:hypothetical protein DQQ10_23570 [Pseudochryseolinea flava]